MAGQLIEKALLKNFVPPSALNAENFQELAGKTYVEEIPSGKTIFKEGDIDRQSIYLVDGQLNITGSAGDTKVVASGTDIARHPVANHQPRKHTCVAKTNAKIIRIDADLLDILLTWDQLSGIEVGEIQVEEDSRDEEGGDGDWMTRILQSKAFLQVPPANIQAMFMRIQELPVKSGQTIIKQGDDGDYYYIIKSGKCKVTRASKTGSELTLATLSDGDAFGEEALLSEAKRNANVIMTTDGTLMRLSKEDFNELLKEPMLSWVTAAQAKEMVSKGAVLVDVRLDSEFKNTGLEGAINLPLFMLRLKADTLDPQKQYILYCDTGRRSSAAAFLLSERGFQACCLQGGLAEYNSA